MIEISENGLVTLIGFAGGLVLGLASRMARFCTLGAIEDALYGGSRDRILMWPLALGFAIVSTFLLDLGGMLAVDEAVYLRFELSITASIAGGLMFGFGMALAGNCGFGALARLGGGDLRSTLIVLTIGISAYMAAIGPLAPLRHWLFPRVEAEPDALPGMTHYFNALTGLDAVYLAVPIGLAMIAIAVRDWHFLANRAAVFWSVMVGLAITSGWWGTSWAGNQSFDIVPVESHTFTMPLGEVLIDGMTASVLNGSFSTGSVMGVLFGAFIGSRIRHQFRWEACDDPGELRRQIFGAGLMGIGGVVALGCSVGQGISAFSVLAWSAPITAAAIGVGAVLGLKYLVEGRGMFAFLLNPFQAFRR